MKLTQDIRERIVNYKRNHPTVGSRQIGVVFRVHHKTVCRVLKQSGFFGDIVASKTPERPHKETHEIKGDSWNISLPKTRIHTKEQLLEYCQVDLKIWEVERFICNKWEVGARIDNTIVAEPLFQVKAFLKKKKNIADAIKELEDLKKTYEKYMPIPPFTVKPQSTGLMLEINMPDPHFGKMAWGLETGYGNYDVKIAEQVYWEALEVLLSRVSHFKFEKIIFVVGNDLFNTDDVEGRTTSGTYVSTDGRYHKTFMAVRNVIIKAIERLRQIASVKVIIVGGNHDQLTCWHLGDSLEMRFINYEDVEIDNLPRTRKYHQFGNVMLMFTHGDKGKRNDYPLLMATEQAVMFGSTKFRECHTGHTHTTKLDEQHGIRVRVLPALCEADDWHSQNGYVGNLRNAEAFVWSAEEGLINMAFYTVRD